MKACLYFFMFVSANSIFAMEVPCDVAAQYRCKSGRLGLLIGRGKTADLAKIVAREQARRICLRKVDYIRFTDLRRNC